ncbi:MAG: STM4012 family radical SAM protein [Aureispira sp.]
MSTLAKAIQSRNYFQGYAYSYPHKSSYRPLEEPRALQEIWQAENKNQLFLYVHVPFCEMRCGFCNLFTTANPKAPLEQPFIGSLQRQATQVKQALGENARFNRVAIGGGTPSFLSLEDLESLFQVVHQQMGLNHRTVPFSVELSPKTTSPEKLALLHQYGTNRASIGVQSFLLEETKALGRPQRMEEVRQALTYIRDSAIPSMNIDLIYGIAGQTTASWQRSLEETVAFQPEEVFLYPLYVRPLTGLGKREQEWNDHRLNLYRFGRDFLLSKGYEQVTMRIFRRQNIVEKELPAYNSPEDGMVGLGVGARSYTREFHYSSDYAVGRKGVQHIIHDYHEKTAQDFSQADYGTYLNRQEQQRRYVIKSLLEGQYLDMAAYERFFGSSALLDLPELQQLDSLQFLQTTEGRLQLNQAGLECSDIIGPWLYSADVKAQMAAFELS